MVVNLDTELANKVKGLKLEWKSKPQPELLIKLPNHNPEVNYQVEIATNEFTSLCPLNLAQPDYATVVIVYRPDKYIVELKSLKFYLASFRQVPIFHEQIPATILNSLTGLLGPKFMEVDGQFTVRGGISTTVRAVYEGK